MAVAPCHASTASWYGEEHRGKVMANRERFNPDALTCASWFHPLGTRLIITRADGIPGGVEVVVTDRGPHPRLVRQGRKIDLSRAAFARIEGLEMGLCEVKIEESTSPRPSPLAEREKKNISPVDGTRAGNGATKKRTDVKPPEESLIRAIPQLAQVRPGSAAPAAPGAMPPNPASHPSLRGGVARGNFAMPNAQCPMPNAQWPMPGRETQFHPSLGLVSLDTDHSIRP